jgi:hypothetical protein
LRWSVPSRSGHILLLDSELRRRAMTRSDASQRRWVFRGSEPVVEASDSRKPAARPPTRRCLGGRCSGRRTPAPLNRQGWSG